MLPIAVVEPLSRHLDSVRRQHQADLARGLGRVVLPFALDRKYPNAATEWGWQIVFPASRVCTDPRWGHRPAFTSTSPSSRRRSHAGHDTWDHQVCGDIHIPAFLRDTPARGWL